MGTTNQLVLEIGGQSVTLEAPSCHMFPVRPTKILSATTVGRVQVYW